MTGGPISAGRPLRADARRNLDRIRTAARRALAEVGVDVSMDEIARRAGVGVGTIYRRFPDKNVLLHDICLDALTRYTEIIRQAGADEADPWAALSRFMSEVIEGGATAVLPIISGRIPLSEELQERGAEYEAALDGLVSAAHDSGQLREDIGAGDILLLLISVTNHPAGVTRDFAAVTRRRNLILILEGMRARPDSAQLPGSPLTAHDISSLYIDGRR